MPLVDIPNVGEVEFPDEMSEVEIAEAIQRDIIRDVMPRVPAPGESEMLRAGATPRAPTQAFPAVEGRMAETAKVPALTGDEREQMLTTPYAEVPQAVAELPGNALAQVPGVNIAAALAPETAAGVKRGIAGLTKGLVEQALLTPAAGALGATMLVPGLRAGVGAVMSAGAAKGAAERLGEGSVTGDPQTITEGLGMGGLALLGAVGTGLDIARSRPGAFLRDVIAENRPAVEIPVELVRPPGARPQPQQGPIFEQPERPQIPESLRGPGVPAVRPKASIPAAPQLSPRQAALLPRTAAAVKQLTEGTPDARKVQEAAEVHGNVPVQASEGQSAKTVPVEEGQPGVRTEEAVTAAEATKELPAAEQPVKVGGMKEAEATPIELEGSKFTDWPKALISKDLVTGEWRFTYFSEFGGETIPQGHASYPTRQAAIEASAELGYKPAPTPEPSSPPPSGGTEVPSVPQETPAPSAQVEAGGAVLVKQDWQMTAREWADNLLKRQLDPREQRQLRAGRTYHKQAVKDALGRGEQVPAKVLADYPDLEKRQPIKGTGSPPPEEPPSNQALGLIPPVPPIIKDIASAVGTGMDWYSQPLTERLGEAGGPTAKGFSNMAKEIVNRSKALYGSITPILDPALKAAGALNRTTTWLNNIAPTSKKWGYRNAVAAVEGPIGAVPAQHLPTVQKIRDANLEIGRLAQSGIKGFTATGKYQRGATSFLVDTIRSGRGPAFDLLVQALSSENHIPRARIRDIFREMKEEFDAPGSRQTIHRIAQEFDRHFKKFPTDLKIKTAFGEIWMPILHAKPFNYLSHAALSTAQRVAFLERIPQGSLDAIRKQVVGELKDPAPFDDLVRALHGLTVDEPWRLAPPGSAMNMIGSGVERVLTDVFGALKLTASAIVNIPETIIGNTPAFYGWKNFAKGVSSLPARHQALETMGAINRNIYDWSLDPKGPMRTILASFRQGLRKATLGQFFNEIQEKFAAATAQVFTEQARGRSLSTREQGLFTEAAVAHGFSRPAAQALARGHGTPEQYDDFVRRASAFSTAGNLMPAERSRLGNSRKFNALFKFQSYSQMKLNSARKAWEGFADAIESGDKARVLSAGEILSKYLFNTTAQGVGAALLAGLFMGRKGGVVETAEDALDGPGAFLLDSFLAGMGGPAAAINYALSSGRLRDVLDPRNINLGSVFPGAVYLELKQLLNREGPYAGMTLTEAIERYSKVKVPAGRVIVRALRAAGAVDEADDSMGELYQRIRLWREKSEDPQVVKDRERKAGQTFAESDYAALRQALKVNDRPRAREAYRDLLKTKERDVIKRTMEANRPFTGSWELERKFRKSLDVEGRKLYREAQRERQRLAARFRAIAP
jgi:hypothetical protein